MSKLSFKTFCIEFYGESKKCQAMKYISSLKRKRFWQWGLYNRHQRASGYTA